MKFIFLFVYLFAAFASFYFIVQAFRQSAKQGFLVLLIPFYVIIWAKKNNRWREFVFVFVTLLALWVAGGIYYS